MIVSHTAVVMATTNPGKIAEMRELFQGIPIHLLALSQLLPHTFAVTEDGDSYEANAIKKARAVARETLLMTLADDSGLEVDALDGAPGIKSARFAGEGASEKQRIESLLKALEGVNKPHRTARFRCVMCLADPWVHDGSGCSDIVLTTGVCEGHIGFSPVGNGGFGFDPIFLVDRLSDHAQHAQCSQPSEITSEITMAQLTPTEKNTLSHRAKAALAMREKIMQMIHRRTAALIDASQT